MPYVRTWARSLFIAPLVILSFSSSAHAAGAYLETFDTNPPLDWVAAEDTWNVTSGYYMNSSTTTPFRAIAYFGDRRWATDFTYSLRMNSDFGDTTSHKVGVVFNFVD